MNGCLWHGGEIMTGQQAIDLIHERSWVGRKPGLERTQALLARMGNPERSLKYVHITGTNGKGSTAAMVASVLSAAGYRTGLFTSPHLYRFHERMQVDGVPIPDEALGRLTEQVLGLAEGMEDHPTEFELMTAVGMAYFAECKCDIVVLEVGLGGRLDSTNVIPAPEVAAITNIGLEHTKELGNTITEIAREKAGILKPGCSCVLYHQGEEAEQLFERTCAEMDIPLVKTASDTLKVLSSDLEGQSFSYRNSGPYRISLIGKYQLYNAAAAIDVITALRSRGWTISEEALLRGLKESRWPGRMELVRRAPDFLVDGGHNPQCVDALMDALEELFPHKKLLFLTGVLADKDWQGMMRRAMLLAKAFVTITPDSPRALEGEELAVWLREQGFEAASCATAEEGVDRVLSMAGPDDVICSWGSLYAVGLIRHHLGLC